MMPTHTHLHLEMIHAEWEREFEAAALRRQAREARRGRTRTSQRAWLSMVVSTIRAHLRPDSRRPVIPEPVEVPCVDC